MRSRHEAKLTLGAERFLAPGENVIRALVAVAKGTTHPLTAARQTAAGAGRARVRLAPQIGLVLTTQRLLALQITTSHGFGHGGDVEELLGAVPLADVDEIVVHRMLLGQTITVTVRGESFRLEANAIACGRELAESLLRAQDDAGE